MQVSRGWTAQAGVTGMEGLTTMVVVGAECAEYLRWNEKVCESQIPGEDNEADRRGV